MTTLGQANNWVFHLISHVTINATGEVTASLEKLADETCRSGTNLSRAARETRPGEWRCLSRVEHEPAQATPEGRRPISPSDDDPHVTRGLRHRTRTGHGRCGRRRRR